MFPTQSKVYRFGSLWLLPVIALAMLLVGYAVFASTTAHAQTVSGDVCVEGIVIDWQEKPLEGWVITLTSDISGFTPITTTSAPEPDEDNEYGNNNNYSNSNSHNSYGNSQHFPYPVVDPEFQKGEFKFSEDAISAAITPTAGSQTGTFTATIETRAGWEGVTPTTLSFPIDPGQDGCVKIRFKMRQIVRVDVYKIDANHDPLGDWKIRAVPGPGNLFAIPQEEETSDPLTMTVGTPPTTTDVLTGGIASFTLTPGLWIFTEQAPKRDYDDQNAVPESYVPIVPPTGRQELVVPDDLDPAADPLQVVFKNELVTGCFIVEKEGLTTDPTITDTPVVTPAVGASFNVGGWGFKLLRKDGTVARQGVTDAIGRLRFDNLPLGPYTLVEEDRPGWDEVSARSVDVDVTGNNCDPVNPDNFVVFQNRQDDSGFCIEGNKVDANGGYGIAGWEMSADPVAKGGFDPDNVFTDGIGHFKFTFPINDYRVPGAEYTVCELEKDGWLADNNTCQKVRLPEWPGACVKLENFVNQQVGHSDGHYSQPEYPHGKDSGKAGPDASYPQQGGPDNSYQNGPQQGNSYPQQGGYNQNGGQQCSTYHVVKAGEGLYQIGAQYQKTAQQMLDANPSLSGDSVIYEGQSICIP
jgi:hypothetical protein